MRVSLNNLHTRGDSMNVASRAVFATISLVVLSNLASAEPSDLTLSRLKAIEAKNAALEKENAALRAEFRRLKETDKRALGKPSGAVLRVAATNAPEEITAMAYAPRSNAVTIPINPDRPFNWTGFYAGGLAGYGWTHVIPPAGSSFIPQPTGGVWGGQLGANYQFAPHWLIGAEVDGAFARLEDSKAGPEPNIPATLIANTIKVKSIETLRGRFGYVHDQSLFYFTGGAAWTNTEVMTSTSNFMPGVPRTRVSSRTMDGWTLGGGIEWMLWSNWSAKAEYLFIHSNP